MTMTNFEIGPKIGGRAEMAIAGDA